MLLFCLFLVNLNSYAKTFPTLNINIDPPKGGEQSETHNFVYSEGSWKEVLDNRKDDKTTKKQYYMFKNMVCHNSSKDLLKTVCCSEKSRWKDTEVYYELPTPVSIPCDEPNCLETCFLIRSIPAYQEFSLTDDLDYLNLKGLPTLSYKNRNERHNGGLSLLKNYKIQPNFLKMKTKVYDKILWSKFNGKNQSDEYNKKFAQAVLKLMDVYETLRDINEHLQTRAKLLNIKLQNFTISEKFNLKNNSSPLCYNSDEFSGFYPESNEGPDYFEYDSPTNANKSNRNSDLENLEIISIYGNNTPSYKNKSFLLFSTKTPNKFMSFSHSNNTAKHKNYPEMIIPARICKTGTNIVCDSSSKCSPDDLNLYHNITESEQNITEDMQELVNATNIVDSNVEEVSTKEFLQETSIESSGEKEGVTAFSGKIEEIQGVSKAELTVAEYINYLSMRTESVYHRFVEAKWGYETNVTHQSRKKLMITSLELMQYQQKLNKALSTVQSIPIQDPLLKRQIKLLFLPGMSSLPDLKIAEFEQVLFAMKTIYTTASVTKWRQMSHKVSLRPVITQVMAKSADPEELQYYWVEWRKVTGRRVRSLFEQYVELINQSALYNGFSDASEMWTRRYEMEDFVQLLAAYVDEIQPFYRHLHTYVRHKLHQRYGDISNATDSGFIPVHLTGDIWGEDWRNLYPIVKPFPQEKDVFKIDLKQNKYTTQKLRSATEKLFHSLGFKPLPESFWQKSKFANENTTNANCESSAWDMVNGTDFRMKFCAKRNMDDLFELHKMLTYIHYFNEYNSLPFPFREPANPAFGDALGGAIVLSAKSRTHLESLGFIKIQNRNKSFVKEKQQDLNFLMHEALHVVTGLPYSYILDLWRTRVFDGTIPSSEYNSKWWELREQYQGVTPPVKRSEEDFDIAAKYQIVANEPYIRNFLSRILEFQFHEALCNKAGYSGPLHKCDITSSSRAGHVLRNVMSKGASQHWRSSMKDLTGERKLSSQPLLRYFKPLHLWLREKNAQGMLHVGWEGNQL